MFLSRSRAVFSSAVPSAFSRVQRMLVTAKVTRRGLALAGLMMGIAAHAAPIPATVTNPTPVSFGSQAVGSAQTQTTVTFTVTSSGNLASTPLVLTQGTANLD